ncbi:MAG: hypothetical protein IJN89_02480, partial [Anaerotignum sp.]|nr:hypothetical protein [Anaerotignum sp.]
MKRKLLKHTLAMALAAVLLCSSVGYFGRETAYAATQYEMKSEKIVTRGVTYEKNSRMTDAGVQNIHV